MYKRIYLLCAYLASPSPQLCMYTHLWTSFVLYAVMVGSYHHHSYYEFYFYHHMHRLQPVPHHSKTYLWLLGKEGCMRSSLSLMEEGVKWMMRMRCVPLGAVNYIVYENIMLYVMCVCISVYVYIPSMAVRKCMHVSIGLSEFHGCTSRVYSILGMGSRGEGWGGDPPAPPPLKKVIFPKYNLL